jgi:ethanolamine transporter EutH
MIDPVADLSVSVALALLLGVAAWHKMSDRVRFGAVLRAYDLLPSWLLTPTARLLVVFEVCVALGLLHPASRKVAAVAAVALLAAYTIAISANLARGRREIDCGCFAASTRVPLSNWLVLRNFILMLAACALLLPVRERTLIWVDGFTVATSLATMSVLWVAAQRLSHTGPALHRMGGLQ